MIDSFENAPELIRVEDLHKSFGGLNVLNGITETIHKGEVVSLIGPSGSGKSTFLRCMTMLEKIDGGSMVYCGKEAVNSDSGVPVYADKADLKEIQSYYGLVFQNFNLFPHYSVLKNIADAPIHVQKRDKDEVYAEAKELLRKMNLEDKGDYYPYQLSGGQQQRVAIVRALAMSPSILFFDEPTSALDPELTGEILSVIRLLAEDHMTMVIVTHEMQFARELSDRIIFMENGVCVQEGTPDEIFHSENERVRDFIGKFVG